MTTLRGMTWNHARGLDPLIAHAREYQSKHDVAIQWDARPLEDFESFPLDQLTAKYDLLVIDHPHVAAAAQSNCLLALDQHRSLGGFAGSTIGNSHESYFYAGHQWALAIDAAAQVSARRTGSLDHWPWSWDEVMELAQTGLVGCSLVPVHALMSFFTICANAGHPCATEGDQLIAPFLGATVLDRFRAFADLMPDFCYGMNPIDILTYIATDGALVYSPLIYGYVTFARSGDIEFGDIPGTRGSTLGGTGIAVSALSKLRRESLDVAFDLASPQVQRGLYASAGGQPAHRDAWTDDTVNAESGNFYRNTLATLDAAYLRPRFPGCIEFQESAGRLIVSCLKGDLSPAATIAQLNTAFAQAQKPQ